MAEPLKIRKVVLAPPRRLDQDMVHDRDGLLEGFGGTGHYKVLFS